MSEIRVWLFVLAVLLVPLLAGADDAAWNGKSAAVVLTYDDALNVHLDNVVPALDARGLPGTFYLALHSEAFRKRIDEWQAAASKGHELGNHSLFHPCRGSLPGRDWVNPEYDLDTYTERRIVDELALANAWLQEIDGQSSRTYAYTCGEMTAGGEDFVAAVRPMFAGLRGVSNIYSNRDAVDLDNINAHGTNGESGAELVALARQAVQRGQLIVFLFHGVGGDHDLDVSVAAHAELLDYLQENQDDIWVATMVDVARYVGEPR